MKNSKPYSQSRREFLRQFSLGGIALAAGAAFPGALLAQTNSAIAAAPKKLGVALLGLGTYSTHQLAPALQQTKLCP